MKVKNRIIGLLLAALFIVGAFASCTNTPEQTSELTNTSAPAQTAEKTDALTIPVTTEPIAVDNVVARFAVLSDAHIGKTNTNPEAKLRSALDILFDMNINTVAIAGDITDRGYDEEYISLRNILDEGTGKNVEYALCMGNHEYFRDGVVRYGGESAKLLKECQEAYRDIMKSELDSDITVGGVHIITLSARNSAADYKECEEFLISHVKAAAGENPSLPIIIVAHENAGTCFEGGCGGYTAATVAELKKYPQIIFFSGHTHHAQNDPRMIIQDSFTTVQLGTVGADFWNLTDSDTAQPENSADCSQGVIVTVEKDGKVTIERYDFFHKEKTGEDWVINTAAGKKGFTYKLNARANTAEKPVFAAGSVLTAGEAGAKSIVLRFPAASVSDSVSDGAIYKYVITAKYTGASAEFVKSAYSDYYLGSAQKKEYEYKLSGLLPGKNYTVSIVAVSCLGASSEALTASFTTLDAADVKAPSPDVLFVDYRLNSYADNGPYSLSCESFGNPVIKNDPLLGSYAAYCGTDDAYAYQLNDDIYSAIKKNITLESYVYIEKKQVYPWGYVDIISNMEGAGFGFELTNGGQLSFNVNTGTYHGAATQVMWESWVHLVGTYDGEQVRLYVNGVLVAETACTGNIKHTKAPSQKLFVGADVDKTGGIQTSANCRVAFVGMYSGALSSEEVEARFEIS